MALPVLFILLPLAVLAAVPVAAGLTYAFYPESWRRTDSGAMPDLLVILMALAGFIGMMDYAGRLAIPQNVSRLKQPAEHHAPAPVAPPTGK